MEKRISYLQFQSAKTIAKAIDPIVRKADSIQKKIDDVTAKAKEALEKRLAKVEEERKSYQDQIDALEAGIFNTTGFHVNQLVKKVVETTSYVDTKTGKPIKATKFLPADNVHYDEQNKEYVITISEDEPVEASAEEISASVDAVHAPFEEQAPGSDFDIDAEAEGESKSDAMDIMSEMPWND